MNPKISSCLFMNENFKVKKKRNLSCIFSFSQNLIIFSYFIYKTSFPFPFFLSMSFKLEKMIFDSNFFLVPLAFSGNQT